MMKKIILFALVACALVACKDTINNEESYSTGKDLSVSGHSYMCILKTGADLDTTIVSFDKYICYANNVNIGNYIQNHEVVRVKLHPELSYIDTDRVYISYGDFLLLGTACYRKIK